ncbi:hypothetical protein PO878_16465 [Iamia majanohamensis]|uniref:ATP-grasp domain-containing protein n=1 Tax=Iamia majanohamensis TaxID=467976 RepID=A0AAE9Y3X3_9ACTN|nr:hypothetical protein [Iamia majanohamensis]WCO66095.1 hypothetical protein PO878_16465 [Iamia majanohamensis]
MRRRPLRVLHLVGSTESALLTDLSLHYASACLAATADPSRYQPIIAEVAPDGRWRFPSDLDTPTRAAAPTTDLAGAVATLAGLELDVAVPQMFCLSGMTHHRALLDLLGIPYVGNTPAAMALSTDKARAKAVVGAAGVLVPEGEVLVPGQDPTLAPPVVVKPVAGDNSVGMALVRDDPDWAAALEGAWAVGPALVERYVPPGREVRAATIVRDGRVAALPLEEYAVDPDHRPVRDVASKLVHDDDGSVRLTAKDDDAAWIVAPDDPVTAAAQDAALRCHAALGCRHYGLFDLRIDPEGRPWFLEAGLYCSFAPQSVIPTMARAAGTTLEALFADLLELALAEGPGGPGPTPT